MTLADLSTLVAQWGYPMVFLIAMLASAGAPLPAAEVLVAAAIYTAHTHRLNIDVLCGGGFLAASIGGFGGYALGGWLGVAGLRRYGAKVGLGPARQRLGQYLFLQHGGKIVVAIRFIALLSSFGAVLAGVNRMPFTRFAAFNIGGAALWALVMAFGGYLFGRVFAALGGPIAVAFLALAVIAVAALVIYVHRQGASLQAKADALLLSSAAVD
ncbi:MAG: DedA family protein [Caulobacteraceae bacterium]